MPYFIVQTSDFTERYGLSLDVATAPLLQTYITRYEKPYLYKLLGKELAELFISDVSSGAPVTARFLTIYNELYSQGDDDELRHSRGIKDILTAAIFYHFIADRLAEHSQSGIAIPNIDLKTRAGYQNALRFAEQKFNDVLISIETIQWYCDEEESETYPEYNGVEIKGKFSSIF